MAFALAGMLLAANVAAQSGGTDGSDDLSGSGQAHYRHRRQQSSGQGTSAPATSDLRVTPDPWPRLDAGAVFCRTAEDLRQHAAAIAARLDGNASAGRDPVGCSYIREATPVVVVAREGLGQTEVRISVPPGRTGQGETGWTDAFLPDKATGE